MQHKPEPKFSFSASDIISLIFTPLGLVFVLLGIGLMYGTGELLFFAIFSGIGSIFLLLGILFLVLMLYKRSLIRKLVTQGHYVTATVTSVQPNYSIRVNGRSPYIAECSYTDPITGGIHLFQSRNIYFDPTTILLDAQVPVYCREDSYQLYYVDVDSILPQVTRH